MGGFGGLSEPEEEALLFLWKTFILSGLDYSSQLWIPDILRQIVVLEEIEHQYTKKSNTAQKMDYKEKLKERYLYSMQRKRERYAVIYI